MSFWTSQADIERYLGSYAADVLSNLNNSTTGPDPAGFADAILQAEQFVDYRLKLFGYPNSVTNPTFPAGSMAYGILTDDATIIAAAWLYIKRGQYDEGMAKLAGAFAKAKEDAEADVKRVIRDRIPDVNRGIKNYPAVIVSPLTYQGVVPASQILEVP